MDVERSMSVISFAREDWENTEKCEKCNAWFTWFKRRHHCRKCFKCVCGKCSPSTIQLDGYPRPQRVCGSCIQDVWPDAVPSDNVLNSLREQVANLQSELDQKNADIETQRIHVQQLTQELEELRVNPPVLGSTANTQSPPPTASVLSRVLTKSAPGLEADDNDFGVSSSQFAEAGRNDILQEEEILKEMVPRLQALLGAMACKKQIAVPSFDSQRLAETCEQTVSALENMFPEFHAEIDQKNAEIETQRIHVQQLMEELEELRIDPPGLGSIADTQSPPPTKPVLSRVLTSSAPGLEADDNDFGVSSSQFAEAGRNDILHEEEIVKEMVPRLQALLGAIACKKQIAVPSFDSQSLAETCEQTMSALENMFLELQTCEDTQAEPLHD